MRKNVRESKHQNRFGLPRGLFLGGKWYAVRVAVPIEYQDIVGKREIVRGLGTQDLAEALKRRPRVLEEIIEAITEGQTPSQVVGPNKPKQGNTVGDAADRWLADAVGISNSTKVRIMCGRRYSNPNSRPIANIKPIGWMPQSQPALLPFAALARF
ncbi:DUF6538 domain-containing protein [Ruegeria sp. HU-ET01832]|uniref:DUF6538 domain-containing protein n=1 Tax=Ruegeria sp. HU-ET01832 TaxID=3135906 RepID=UPI0033426AC4